MLRSTRKRHHHRSLIRRGPSPMMWRWEKPEVKRTKITKNPSLQNGSTSPERVFHLHKSIGNPVAMIDMKEFFVVTFTNIVFNSIGNGVIEFRWRVVGVSRLSIRSNTRSKLKFKFRQDVTHKLMFDPQNQVILIKCIEILLKGISTVNIRSEISRTFPN